MKIVILIFAIVYILTLVILLIKIGDIKEDNDNLREQLKNSKYENEKTRELMNNMESRFSSLISEQKKFIDKEDKKQKKKPQ
jgi:predicted Holliday junction resolvase-like endonuclease